MKITTFAVICLILATAVCGYAADAPAKPEPANALVKTEPVASKITLDVKDKPVAEAITSIASQSKCKILAESNIKGKVTLALNDVPVDAALTAVCKSTNLIWRKVYIDPKSELLDKPDRFAATLRLMAGLSFPDLVIASSSNSKIGVHCQQKQGVQDAQDKIVKDLGMEPVYLVSNDALVAAKEAAKNTPVSKYTEMAKEQLDMFMKMTPEDREQAMMAGLDLMDSVGPEYYSSMMQTMMNSDPVKLQRIQKRGTDMLFSMTSEQRRQMMRMNMHAMDNVTPEQMQILQEDAKAIAEEIKNQQPQPAP
jgi:hypothetical protein